MDRETRTLLLYVGIGIVVWLLWKKLSAATTAAITAPGKAAGNIIYDLLNPGAGNRATSIVYIAVFPDGSKHAVDSADVASDNTFTWAADGQNYTLFQGVAGNAAVLTSTIVGVSPPATDPGAWSPATGGA